MRKLSFLAALVGGLVLLLVGGSLALAKGDHGNARAKLIGSSEVPATSTLARGSFKASIDKDAKTIKYTLQYQGIEGGTAVAAHIHFAQRDVNGGIVAFLCGGGGKPACPSPGGTVEGTIGAADVLAQNPNQGIAAGQFDELVGALRRGLTYVNVHSNPGFLGGEIRGQIKGRGDDDDD